VGWIQRRRRALLDRFSIIYDKDMIQRGMNDCLFLLTVCYGALMIPVRCVISMLHVFRKIGDGDVTLVRSIYDSLLREIQGFAQNRTPWVMSAMHRAMAIPRR